jgi:hypothetical protein
MKTNKTKRAGRSKRRTLKRKQRGGVKETIPLDEDSVVEGDIRKNKVRGRGKRTFADGSVYEGHFDGFIPHGQGKLIMSDGRVYEGEFSEGGINGRGVMTDPKGNVIEGEFITVQDERGMEFALATGMGELTYAATGTVYRGEFRNGKFNGHGTLTMTDGSVFEGDFQNGLADGVGRLTHADGTFEEGLFRHINGELVHLDMPSLELDLELNPGPWNPKLKTRYNAERAIAERPSGAQ